jgi:L-seryl-tRNA(Ser) seleniumtransferase
LSRAIATGKAAGVLQVHRSNFALVGFVKTPPLADLATLAHDHGLPMLVDLGSGALAPLDAVRTGGGEGSERREPTVPEVLAGGADVVTFSGDKLIGGPQAGIIVGKRAFVQQLAGSAMARALRVCNLTLAGLEQVLRLHLQGRANEHLPVLAALVQGETEVDAWAHALAAALRARLGAEWSVAVDACEAEPGGGTDPLVRLPSRCLALQLHGVAAETLATAALRVAVPVIGRVRGDHWLLDVRTLKAGSPSAVAADGNALADELAVSLLHVRREIAEAAGASITAD